MRRWIELEEELGYAPRTLNKQPGRVVDADPAPQPTYAHVQPSPPPPANRRGRASAWLLALLAVVGAIAGIALLILAPGVVAWAIGLLVIGIVIVGVLLSARSLVSRARH